MILALSSYASVQRLFQHARQYLGETLSAFEFWDRAANDMTLFHLKLSPFLPSSPSHPFYVLVETSGSSEEHDHDKIMNFLETMMANNVVLDGAVSQDTRQSTDMWRIREGIPEASSKMGAVYKVFGSTIDGMFYFSV